MSFILPILMLTTLTINKELELKTSNTKTSNTKTIQNGTGLDRSNEGKTSNSKTKENANQTADKNTPKTESEKEKDEDEGDTSKSEKQEDAKLTADKNNDQPKTESEKDEDENEKIIIKWKRDLKSISFVFLEDLEEYSAENVRFGIHKNTGNRFYNFLGVVGLNPDHSINIHTGYTLYKKSQGKKGLTPIEHKTYTKKELDSLNIIFQKTVDELSVGDRLVVFGICKFPTNFWKDEEEASSRKVVNNEMWENEYDITSDIRLNRYILYRKLKGVSEQQSHYLVIRIYPMNPLKGYEGRFYTKPRIEFEYSSKKPESYSDRGLTEEELTNMNTYITSFMNSIHDKDQDQIPRLFNLWTQWNTTYHSIVVRNSEQHKRKLKFQNEGVSKVLFDDTKKLQKLFDRRVVFKPPSYHNKIIGLYTIEYSGTFDVKDFQINEDKKKEMANEEGFKFFESKSEGLKSCIKKYDKDIYLIIEYPTIQEEDIEYNISFSEENDDWIQTGKIRTGRLTIGHIEGAFIKKTLKKYGY